MAYRRCGIDVLVAGRNIVSKRATAAEAVKEARAWSSNSVAASTAG
jgi:hypothetical protein